MQVLKKNFYAIQKIQYGGHDSDTVIRIETLEKKTYELFLLYIIVYIKEKRRIWL